MDLPNSPIAEVVPAQAAGVLFIAEGKVLLVQRAPGSDHVGEWCTPGGGLEVGEDALGAALRECSEELGWSPAETDEPKPVFSEHSRWIAEGVDYTVFVCRLDEQFTPTLCTENSNWGWFSSSELPPNLHPGTRIALNKMGWNELDIARAIQAGDLTSPQRYLNVWLFDIRITGTGYAYRDKGEEFVWRDPEVYLNDEFLARCNGLVVIFGHPDKSMLTSQEFADRTVGAILLPYIKGDEVWGIAKVYDDATALIMRTKQMSTSPAVQLRKGEPMLTLEDGAKLLIEGEPLLLDHIAICEAGVWDKLKAPTGVNTAGDITMAEEAEKVEDKKDAAEDVADKKDAAEDKTEAKADSSDDKLDAFMKRMDARMDSVCARMDAQDEARKADSSKKDGADVKEEGEAKEVAADKKDAAEDKTDKKDAAEESGEVKEAKADAAAARADAADTRRRLDELQRTLPKQLNDGDYTEMADAQARADNVFNAFGKQAPGPLRGEHPMVYRKRLATSLKVHSDRWGKVDLIPVGDEAFGIIEADVYADAMAAAANPVNIAPGVLMPVTNVDRDTGIRTTRFHGRNTFIAGMKRQPQRARIVSDRRNQH